MKTALKRTLSLMLTVVMLVSCWVFTAPKADAATAGSYYIKITGAMEGWKTLFVSNSNLNNSFTAGWDSATNDSCGMVVRYNTNNGHGTQADPDQTVDLIGQGWGSVPTSKTTKTATATVSGFPTGFYFCLDQNDAAGTTKMYVTKIEIGSSSSNLKTLWSGTIQLNSTNATKKAFIYSDGTSSTSSDASVSANSGWSMPYVNSISSSVSGGVSSMDVPTNGSYADSSSAFTATLYDNYGVSWYQDPDYSVATTDGSAITGASMVSKKLRLYPTANRADNYTARVTLYKGNNISVYKDVTINVFDYTVKFYDTKFDGTTGSLLKTQTDIDYNSSATPPSNPAAKYTSTLSDGHKTFKEWSGTYQNLTSGAQEQIVTATYNAAASHGNWTYSEISGNDNYHKRTCGTCAYNDNTQQHNYGATTITFATNGQSATCSKTCQTTGCGHVYSKAATVTGEVTTDPTCTEMGVTTYTATSTFSNDSTSSTTTRTDVAALGHNWNTPSFTWSDSVTPTSATATATRVCAISSNYVSLNNN